MTPDPRRWLFTDPEKDLPLPENSIASRYLADETDTVLGLAAEARLGAADSAAIDARARQLVTEIRRLTHELSGIDAFIHEYDLSSAEGIALMCLAEALLRIPDSETADALIADKLGDADFQRHLGASESPFVNAATWALMLTGRVLHRDTLHPDSLTETFGQALGRLGEPVIRSAMRKAMQVMGHQFVMGRTIDAALERAGRDANAAYRYSFDMLGEAALTAADARRYLDAYAQAIHRLGDAHEGSDLIAAPGISVKLSALCPRFEVTQAARAVVELARHVSTLAKLARRAGIALTIDAEEADRLDLTLAVFREVFASPALDGWPGLGIAVQAYQKRAPAVIDWLEARARSAGRTIPVRLVKGAYWDTEIKRAQEQGLAGYPVFTRKSSTDVSYLACARRLLHDCPHLYPQFATHNAHAVAWLERVGAGREFEFQRLHGMGEALYRRIVGAGDDAPGGDAPEGNGPRGDADGRGPDGNADCDRRPRRPCRVYAPVGSHEDLLPYLVRRLLENGANTSFVNRIVDESTSVDAIVRDPVAETLELGQAIPHPRIPLPAALYGSARQNSHGLNLADPNELAVLAVKLSEAEPPGADAAGAVEPGAVSIAPADAESARAALGRAAAGFPDWSARPAGERAALLRRAAELLERERAGLVALGVREGGRTVPDSLAELREAVDFLRYYAAESERLFAAPVTLDGPTGQHDSLRLIGRGVFLCISPWNFPLAIFTGQVAAALAAGNTVLAKPAEPTPRVAARVVGLLYAAGIPRDALALLPGAGPVIGDALCGDPRLAGVAFTGSTATAQTINRALAARTGPLATLIAETGGINAMIVDSSALTEQVVRDVVLSAFNSAGQRCSALRLLCLQDDTADAVLRMLRGHMAELVIGDPALLATDVGPVIDAEAAQHLLAYIEGVRAQVRFQCALPPDAAPGSFVPPTLVGIERPADLKGEVFGPVLHYLRYPAEGIDALVEEINALGYGLTLGIHSRIDDFAERIVSRARVGNVYINRNMIGAVVGVQPFGGMGLSGTGPKAGGPHYLPRFATEQAVSVNTAAVGGNASLLSLGGGE